MRGVLFWCDRCIVPVHDSFLILPCFVLLFQVLFWSSATAAEPPPASSQRSSLLSAELSEELAYLREETVVTPMWKEQPISEAPSNVYVITAEDIRLSGATDVPTLLRLVPGMSVIEKTGGEFDVSARGNNQEGANKLLILIDGRSAYIDAQGVAPWRNLPVSLIEIERIEVLKGPSAAVYGFNAFDGVINIITKSPGSATGSTVQVGAGEYGTIRSAAMYANRHDRLGYRLAVSHDQNQQWRDRHALANRANRFNGLLDYQVGGDGVISLEGGIVSTNRLDAAAEVVRFDTPNDLSYARINYERPNFFVRAFWSQQANTVSFTAIPPLDAFLTVGDRSGRTSGVPIVNDTYDVVSQYSLDLMPSQKLIAGLNYRQSTLSSTQISQFGREQRVGLYLQDEWRPHPQLGLTAGVRMDLHSELNPTYNPRVALLYTLAPNHTFRISGSVGHRSPTLIETNILATTTVNLFGFATTATTVGSSNLKPEQIVTYEAEYQGWFLKHRLRPRVAVFWNHLTDLITGTSTSPITSTWTNTPGVADIRGGEVGVEFLATPWLRGFVNYSYQDTRQSITGQAQRGGPHSLANGGLQVDLDNGINGEIAVSYVGAGAYPIRPEFAQFAALGFIPGSSVPDPRVGSYTLLNLRAGYRFWRERAEVALAVYNALNDKHREHPIGDVIGSRAMGWLTVKY